MPHNDYARPDGIWPDTAVPTPGDLRTWDVAQAQAINATDGGTWAPAKPVTFGGAGLHLTGGGHQILGGITTASGGRLVAGDHDYTDFNGGTRIHTIQYPLARAVIRDGTNVVAWGPSMEPFGLQALVAAPAAIFLPIPKRCLHHGATLVTAVLDLRIGQQHAAIPGTSLPGFILARANASGGSGFLSVSGFHLPTPATPSAYYLDGSVQTITGSQTQNNVIDTSTYGYFLVLSDEQGTGSLPGNIFTSLTLIHADIPDMAFE